MLLLCILQLMHGKTKILKYIPVLRLILLVFDNSENVCLSGIVHLSNVLIGTESKN